VKDWICHCGSIDISSGYCCPSENSSYSTLSSCENNCADFSQTCGKLNSGGIWCPKGYTCKGTNLTGEALDSTSHPGEICCEGKCIPSGGGNTGGGSGGNALIENPLSFDTLVELLNKILDFIWKLAIVFAPIMLLVGGFYIMTAGGNPANLEKGKKIMIYTVIGFAIVLLSRALVSLFKEILGAKDTQSLLQLADALKVFCFSGIMDVKKTLFKRSAN
jgi:hypothetical protein